MFVSVHACVYACVPLCVGTVFAEGKCGITEKSHLVFALFCPQALSHVGPQLRFGEIKPERSVVRHFEKKMDSFCSSQITNPNKFAVF